MGQPKKYPGSDYQELFNHLCDEHDLIVLESQMQDIINIVNKMQFPDRESELIEMLEEISDVLEDAMDEVQSRTTYDKFQNTYAKLEKLMQSVKQTK